MSDKCLTRQEVNTQAISQIDNINNGYTSQTEAVNNASSPVDSNGSNRLCTYGISTQKWKRFLYLGAVTSSNTNRIVTTSNISLYNSIMIYITMNAITSAREVKAAITFTGSNGNTFTLTIDTLSWRGYSSLSGGAIFTDMNEGNASPETTGSNAGKTWMGRLSLAGTGDYSWTCNYLINMVHSTSSAPIDIGSYHPADMGTIPTGGDEEIYITVGN